MRFSISIISQGLLALLTLQAAAAPVVSTGSELQQRDPNLVNKGKELFNKGKQVVGQVSQAKKDYDRVGRLADKAGKIFGRDEPQQI